jgi:hypothetical protein
MNETLNLEEYRCRKCRRLLYINAVEHSSLNIDFSCPYGCDDNGEHARDIVAQIKEEADGRVNDFQTIKKITMLHLVSCRVSSKCPWIEAHATTMNSMHGLL